MGHRGLKKGSEGAVSRGGRDFLIVPDCEGKVTGTVL